jgi:hypothetical protein
MPTDGIIIMCVVGIMNYADYCIIGVRRHKNMKNNTEIPYSFYLVAYVDILGQRAKIRDLRMPLNQEDYDRTLASLKETAGVVLGLRDMFETSFSELSKPSEISNNLSPEMQSEIMKLRRNEINFMGFSDSIIVSVNLANNDYNLTPMNGIYPALFTLCNVFLSMLAIGHPIRGGIDIGPCVSLPNSEIYGAALERAYYLESKVANYPRLVVGKELYDYILEVKNQEKISFKSQIANKYAEKSLKLITIDKDNRYTLDYLGKEVQEIAHESDGIPISEVRKKALAFIEKQLDYFYNRDDKLYKRYFQVYEYIKLNAF